LKHVPDKDKLRIDSLAGKLAQVHLSQQRLTYQDVEHACQLLAEKMLQVYSREELAQIQFAAIPRGGMFVLGILSYVLNLSHEQLSSNWHGTDRLVLVDDCAFSGARFSQALAKSSALEVVFAPLYSHPGFREAVLQAEPRVTECLSAHDLQDRPLSDEELKSWRKDRKEWLQRLVPPDRYWLGAVEKPSFPWTEPDTVIWNPEAGRCEDGWFFSPPQECLKNRYRWGLPPRAVRNPSIQVSPTTAFSYHNGTIWLCETRSRKLFSIEGVAAEMWKSLSVYGDLDVALDYLMDQYDASESDLKRDLVVFTEELLRKGLLERLTMGIENETEHRAPSCQGDG
jgi:Coenzyme PQQ synthesis protein D (PqqD)